MRTGHGEEVRDGLDGLDRALDSQLQAALDVDPSPEFLARVRTEIASQPARRWRMSWSYAGGAIAVAVLLMVAAMRNGVDSTDERVVNGVKSNIQRVAQTPDSGAISAGQAVNPTQEARPAPTPRAVVATSIAEVTQSSEPEVVFSIAEIRAFRRLTALASQGDVLLESLLAPPADPAPITDITPVDIVIPPITIEPLAVETQ